MQYSIQQATDANGLRLKTTLYLVAVIIYNVFFHPLAKFPGPKSCAATCIPYAYDSVRGRSGQSTKALHKKYGDVVRVSPNELSFTNSEAWKAIYGSRPGHAQNQKDSGFYPPTIGGAASLVISNDEDHYRFRRTLSHAFSESSLRAQEPIVKSYVDLLMQRLRENCAGGSKPLNMVSWYNFTTFDIIGDMAFGESFGCLQNSTYHKWVSFVFSNIRYGSYRNVARRFPGSKFLLRLIVPAHLPKEDQWHRQLTTEKVKGRLAKSNDRMDFFAHILKQKDTERALSFPEMLTNSSSFIIAGSETTASLLSGITYYLLKNERVLEKLQQEVRGAFKSEADITVAACNRLEYLNAVLMEGLRIFPPAPTGLPRVINGQGTVINGRWVPGGVSPALFHMGLRYMLNLFVYRLSWLYHILLPSTQRRTSQTQSPSSQSGFLEILDSPMMIKRCFSRSVLGPGIALDGSMFPSIFLRFVLSS